MKREDAGQFKIDIKEFKPGIYLVKLNKNDGLKSHILEVQY